LRAPQNHHPDQVHYRPAIAFYQTQDPGLSETLRLSQEAWRLIAGQFNDVHLRSYPVGIPSLLVGRLPIATPGNAAVVELFTAGQVFLAWLFLVLLVSPWHLIFRHRGPGHPGWQINWQQVINRYLFYFENFCLALVLVGMLLVIASQVFSPGIGLIWEPVSRPMRSVALPVYLLVVSTAGILCAWNFRLPIQSKRFDQGQY
jgi:hypothetical protein